jgi:hypothetical protein
LTLLEYHALSEPDWKKIATFFLIGECGKMGEDFKGRIDAGKNQFPWHATVYLDGAYMCSGSLICE